MPFVQDVYVLFLKLEKLFGKWNEKMSYIKKHKKIMFIIGIVILLLVIFFLWQRENTREKTLSAQLEDNPRKETETESQFYFKFEWLLHLVSWHHLPGKIFFFFRSLLCLGSVCLCH